MRHETAVAALLCLASFVGLVGGCASRADYVPPPATAAEREGALDRYYDARWAELETRIPGLERPEVARVAIVDDDQWVQRMELCLGEFGIDDAVPHGFQVALLSCQERYPSRGMYETMRSEAQLDYLYQYNSRFVSPCLLLSGLPVPSPPAREDFFSSNGYNWNVYQGDRATTDRLKQLLLWKCPPPSE